MKKTVLYFLKGTVKVLWFYFVLIRYEHKMTKYNTLNVKLSKSQPNKLKSGIKNGTEVTVNLSWNLCGNSNDENNSPHKLLLNDPKVSKICKAFENGSSANIKFSKTQLPKILQVEGFLF